MRALLAAAGRKPAWIGWAAAILVAGTVGVYFRLYPLTIFPRDLSLNNARFVVTANMRRMVLSQMEQKFPNISAAERARRANAVIHQKIRSTPREFERLVIDQARSLERDHRTATRGGFLLEVDPYYYMSQTERILRTGRISDETRGREYRNPMTLAPGGYWYPMDLHPYVGAVIHRAAAAFAPKLELKDTLRWVPVALALAALGVFAVYCRQIAGITGIAGLFGLIYLSICPMFLKRSLVGWYDTDPYNILFPLTAIAGIFLAFGGSASPRQRWVGSAVAAAAFALHGLMWRGWMIPFLVIVLLLAAAMGVPRAFRPQGLTVRRHAALLLPIVLVPFAVIGLVWGPLGVAQELGAAGDFIRGFLQPSFRPWPDVFITVGELNPMGFGKLTGLLGGPIVVGAILTGLTLRLIHCFRERGSAAGSIIPLAVLLAVTCIGFVVSVRMQRFAILAVAPMAAALPFAWTEWRERLIQALPKVLAPRAVEAVLPHIGKVWAVLTFAVILSVGARAHAEIVRFYPIYNPAWDKMMAEVREKTPKDAIVTGWWSPGHFLTSMGQRRVTLDGSSQNEPQAYWVANLFIENSEQAALGILRMLDTSGNASVDYLTARGFSIAEAVELIKTIVPLTREDARAKLARRFEPAVADGLVALTHGASTPAPAAIFVYNHMIEQILALEFIGRWNFRKAEAFETFVRERPDEVDGRQLSRATPQNTKLLWAMTDQPTFTQSEGYPTGAEGSMLVFSNGVRIDPLTLDARIQGNAHVNGRPFSVFRINDQNELIETPLPNPTLQTSILLIEDKRPNGQGSPSYRTVIMGRRLAGSVAMRLYYLGGRGLKWIHKIASEDSATYRTRLGLYRVDWDGFEKG